MTDRLHRRLRAESGASFSFAILAFLVCAAVSAVVIAAATASAGQFARLAEADQRYYAVTSAAELFRQSLGEDGETTLTFVTERTGHGFERVDAEDDEDDVDVEGVEWEDGYTLKDPLPAGEGGYDFLTPITCFALFGQGLPAADAALPVGTDAPFASDVWAATTALHDYASYHYDITPNLPGSAATAADLAVEVEARLHDDWTVELVVSNKADAETDRFYLYLLFEGMYESRSETSETLGDTQVVGGVVKNGVDLTETRRSIVSWQLKQIVPGRGFADG